MMRLNLGSLVIVLALAGCAMWSSTGPQPPGHTAATPPAARTTARSATAASTPPTADAFVSVPELPDLRFASGQTTVGKADIAPLDGVVRWLKDHSFASVLIEGHTDDVGSRDANLAVSEKRVESVRHYLLEKEIEPSRISVVSYGPDRPLCIEKTNACRAKNRRIQFLVTQP
jgi:peptidoglycan-associated lipoprotein